jgi:mono/diheme cytochrome c family protein
MSDPDLQAMATYLKSRAPSPTANVKAPDTDAMRRGEAVYQDTCSACHMMNGQGQPRFFPPLRGDPNAQQNDPSSVIHVILNGARTAPSRPLPTPLSMPTYAWKLTDGEIADVSTYIRNSWGNHAAPVTAHQVAALRKKLALEKPPPTVGAPGSGQ